MVSGTAVSAETDDKRLLAQGFTTGDHPHGYTVSSDSPPSILRWGSGDAVQVSIWSSRQFPDTQVRACMCWKTRTRSRTTFDNTFTAPADSELKPDTDYFVLFEATAGSFNIRTVQHADENSGGALGWSIEDHGLTEAAMTKRWEQNADTDYVVRVTIDGSARRRAPFLVSNLDQPHGDDDDRECRDLSHH